MNLSWYPANWSCASRAAVSCRRWPMSVRQPGCLNLAVRLAAPWLAPPEARLLLLHRNNVCTPLLNCRRV